MVEVVKEHVCMRNVKPEIQCVQNLGYLYKGWEIKIGQDYEGYGDQYGFCLVGNGDF